MEVITCLDPTTLHPRDEKDVDGGGIYLIIGKTGSGKTSIIKSLLLAKRAPVTIAVSESEIFNNSYGDSIPPCFIYDTCDPELLNRLTTRQVSAITNGMTDYRINLVYDDCMVTNSNFREEEYTKMFKTSRHYKLFCLVACQALKDIKPTLRGQASGVFLMKSDNKDIIMDYYTEFGSMFPDLQVFRQIFDLATQDYNALFINLRSKSNNWLDKVNYFKAYKIKLERPGIKWDQFVSLDAIACNNLRYDPNYSPHKRVLEELKQKKNKKLKR